MNNLFWTGKLTFPMKVLIESNNLLVLLTGNMSKKQAMKDRVKKGYEGEYSQHVTHYDEIAGEFQKRAAAYQLYKCDFQGKQILDVGGGTGIMALMALEMGASKAICGDISEFMLKQGRNKANNLGYNFDRIEFRQLDAEALPFEDNSFDFVMTGMAFGLYPDQEKAVKEMFRVLRPGGFISLGAHGPEHYWEAIDASLRVMNKKYFLGYRFEFWPRSEKQIHSLMKRTGFTDISTNRFIWRNLFKTPEDAFKFFSSVTSSWWLSKIPEERRAQEDAKTLKYFERKDIRVITDDIIIGFGNKFL